MQTRVVFVLRWLPSAQKASKDFVGPFFNTLLYSLPGPDRIEARNGVRDWKWIQQRRTRQFRDGGSGEFGTRIVWKRLLFSPLTNLINPPADNLMDRISWRPGQNRSRQRPRLRTRRGIGIRIWHWNGLRRLTRHGNPVERLVHDGCSVLLNNAADALANDSVSLSPLEISSSQELSFGLSPKANRRDRDCRQQCVSDQVLHLRSPVKKKLFVAELPTGKSRPATSNFLCFSCESSVRSLHFHESGKNLA